MSLKTLVRRRPNFAVWAIMGGSFLLNFLNIAKEGFGDKFYAAAVRSMMSSWHNFFFASFDPAGFVTVDKPPLGLWLQTLSATVFGFRGWALIIPQALAGALSAGLLYVLVGKAFGRAAGLAAAIVLAVTPISVATARTNQSDCLLVFVLLLAAAAISIAAEHSSLSWLFAGFALVGLGFNIKMLAAYTALPAFSLLYLLGARLKFWKKIAHLAAAALVMLAVSLPWALIVDFTPKDSRPYVGGSSANSVIDLAVGYNGINRLIPQWLRRGRRPPFAGPGFGPRGAGLPTGKPPQAASAPGGASATSASTSPGLKPGLLRSGGGPFGFETGRAGVLRLFNRQMGGQAGWLIIFGLAGTAVAASRMRKPLFQDRKSRAVLLWLVWFFTLASYFSIAGFFHRYYLALIAPAAAALCGIALVEMWQSFREKGIRKWALPLVILAAAAVQAALLIPYPAWGNWLIPAMVVPCLVSAFMLIKDLTARYPHFSRQKIALAFGLAGLMITPIAWSISPIAYGESGAMPFAGPDLSRGAPGRPSPNIAGPPGMMGALANEPLKTARLLEFLKKNRSGEKFLLAVPSARLAWDIIIETGEPVMAMGGFSGSDRILTVEKLEQMVKNGDVRYFLIQRMLNVPAGLRPQRPAAGPGMRGMFGGGGPQLEIFNWLRSHGAVVPGEAWKDEANRQPGKSAADALGSNPSAQPLRPMMRAQLELYDLKPPAPNG